PPCELTEHGDGAQPTKPLRPPPIPPDQRAPTCAGRRTYVRTPSERRPHDHADGIKWPVLPKEHGPGRTPRSVSFRGGAKPPRSSIGGQAHLISACEPRRMYAGISSSASSSIALAPNVRAPFIWGCGCIERRSSIAGMLGREDEVDCARSCVLDTWPGP